MSQQPQCMSKSSEFDTLSVSAAQQYFFACLKGSARGFAGAQLSPTNQLKGRLGLSELMLERVRKC